MDWIKNSFSSTSASKVPLSSGFGPAMICFLTSDVNKTYDMLRRLLLRWDNCYRLTVSKIKHE